MVWCAGPDRSERREARGERREARGERREERRENMRGEEIREEEIRGPATAGSAEPGSLRKWDLGGSGKRMGRQLTKGSSRHFKIKERQ